MKFPEVLFALNPSDEALVDPASLLVCCTSLIGFGVVTVKSAPLLETPAPVTPELPVVAAVGTGTTILVSLQLVGVAGIPLNPTVLVPCVAPKFNPVMVTEVPAGPIFGLRPVRTGAFVTVKATPLLASPPTVTTTFPVVAPRGTSAVIFVALQLVGEAAVPLNVTVLSPWVAPNPVPAIAIGARTGAGVPNKLVMFGWIPKATPFLPTPPPVTTIPPPFTPPAPAPPCL